MKAINLNGVIYSLICLLIFTSCSAQKLVYEPLGEMDKPLPTIVIATTKIQKTTNEKSFVVDKAVFQSLVKYTKDHLGNKSNTTKGNYEYGCYKITFYTGAEKTEYIIDSRTESWSFFNEQLLLVISNEDLHNELEVLLKRLK